MTAMHLVLLHGATGLVDEFLELGLPLLIFGGLYWWSTRKERRKKKEPEAVTKDETP